MVRIVKAHLLASLTDLYKRLGDRKGRTVKEYTRNESPFTQGEIKGMASALSMLSNEITTVGNDMQGVYAKMQKADEAARQEALGQIIKIVDPQRRSITPRKEAQIMGILKYMYDERDAVPAK
jgi:hypothetical protein